MIDALDVYLNTKNGNELLGRTIFHLRRGKISTDFTYDAAYLASPDAFPLEPAMPLSASFFHCESLPGCFRDSLPDRWGRSIIHKQLRISAAASGQALRSLDEVDYLIGVFDSTRQGALRFRERDTGFLAASEPVPPLIELPTLLEASRSVASGKQGHDAIKTLLDAGSGSLGGARPKASVTDGETLLLAKFPHPSDEWDVMAWEKTALDLATLVGIRVPANRCVSVASRRVLLLERFDRAGAKTQGTRLPYISAMTLLASDDGEERDWLEVADRARFFVNDPAAELRQLFARIALSIALHNTDDHLRNTGFLREEDGFVLAPAFDINPNPYFGKTRATSIYGEAADGEAVALKNAASDFMLDAENARMTVAKVLKAMAQWRTLARRNGCSSSEIAMFAPTVENRIQALKDAFVL